MVELRLEGLLSSTRHADNVHGPPAHPAQPTHHPTSGHYTGGLELSFQCPSPGHDLCSSVAFALR